MSVLIDSYNYGNFIEQAIESVLSQDLPVEQVEIVVVDDGSTDDTRTRVKKYGTRIKYIGKENGGQASAFNCGFANTTGKYVALLDADDFFLPGKLKRALNEFQLHPETGMIYHKLPEMHGDGRMAPAPGFQELSGYLPRNRRNLSLYSAHQTSCLVFRRDALADLIPMPESMRIQADAYLELLAVLITPVRALPEELAVYRIHGKNLCAVDVMTNDAAATMRILKSTGIVANEIRQWAAAHPEKIKESDAAVLVNRLMFPLLERKYAHQAPARREYFRYLCMRNRTLSPAQSWLTTAFNYASAGIASILGYRLAHVLKAQVRSS